MPSGWARSNATTRVSRARRSRLPDLGSSSTPAPLRSGARRHDVEIAAPRRRRQIDPDRALERAVADAARVAVHAAGHPAELIVGEDPVVELAPPAPQLIVPDEPGDGRKRPPERRAVDRDPAVRGAGALDDVDAVELGRVAGSLAQGGGERLDVDRAVCDVRELGPPPATERLADPRLAPDPGFAVEPQLLGRRGVGQPPEVRPGAVAGEVDAADRPAVEVGEQVELEPRARADRDRRVAW